MEKKDGKGITKIAVEGFKSIAEECEIEIRPLTILAGANSSGKSSIMQPLLMLKQTLEAPYDPGPLLIDGPNVRFTSATQFLSTQIRKKGKRNCFQIGIQTDDRNVPRYVKTTFKKGENEFKIVKMTIEEKIKQLIMRPEMSPTIYIDDGDNQNQEHEEDIICKRTRCFLQLESIDGNLVARYADNVESNILNCVHLPGLRGNPERNYKQSSIGPLYPGTFVHYPASLIQEWQETADRRLKTVTNSLQTLALTGLVAPEKIGDIGIEIQVGQFPHDRSDKTDMVSIADVGFGVSQVLPVIVALIAAAPGQLVYIEQPELHLHPNAQVALAQVLADAAKRGVRVVAETHSSLLLLGVQTLIAEGKLSPDLVKLHWFSRNQKGITEVDSVDIDESGRYGEWSVDFDEVDINAENRYLNALDKLRFGKE